MVTFGRFCVAGHMDIHNFWGGRYALLAAMVARSVNVLMLDTDFVIHLDIYADLHEPCMAAATIVAHGEGGGPNGGFIYTHKAHPDGAVHWVLSQIKRRVDLFSAALNETGKNPGSTMDQDILKDAVRVATAHGGSIWDMGLYREADHPFWVAHPQSYNGSYPVCTAVRLADNLTCVGASRFNRSGTGELAGWTGANNRPISMQVLYKPADAPGEANDALPEEHLLYAPGYIIQFGHVANIGWNPTNPVSALTHLLGAGPVWLPRVEDAAAQFSHVARLATMQAFGFWHPGINKRVAASRKLLFITHSLVETASRKEDIMHVFELVSRALHAAVITNRTLVLPRLPCDAPWIVRSNNTNGHGGISDRRVFVILEPPYGAGDVSCYVGAHSLEFCWPWDFVVFGFDPIALERAPAATLLPWSRDGVEGASGDVMINHLPAIEIMYRPIASDAAAIARVELNCFNYFNKPQNG